MQSAADCELDCVYGRTPDASRAPHQTVPNTLCLSIRYRYQPYVCLLLSCIAQYISTSFLGDLKQRQPCKSSTELTTARHQPSPINTSVMPVAVPSVSVSRPTSFPPPE